MESTITNATPNAAAFVWSQLPIPPDWFGDELKARIAALNEEAGRLNAERTDSIEQEAVRLGSLVLFDPEVAMKGLAKLNQRRRALAVAEIAHAQAREALPEAVAPVAAARRNAIAELANARAAEVAKQVACLGLADPDNVRRALDLDREYGGYQRELFALGGLAERFGLKPAEKAHAESRRDYLRRLVAGE